MNNLKERVKPFDIFSRRIVNLRQEDNYYPAYLCVTEVMSEHIKAREYPQPDKSYFISFADLNRVYEIPEKVKEASPRFNFLVKLKIFCNRFFKLKPGRVQI